MNQFGSRLLDVVTYLPLVGAVLLLLVPHDKVRVIPSSRPCLPGWGFSRACRCGSLGSPPRSTRTVSGSSTRPTGSARSARAHIVGVDGISMLLVLLTTLLGFVATLSAWKAIERRVKAFSACLLVLETGMMDTFYTPGPKGYTDYPVTKK